ncbi:MAG: hypothetical protein PWQ67_2279 [Clostridia bacterium]|nr:hypothetical protein [Clostridia bacterium]
MDIQFNNAERQINLKEIEKSLFNGLQELFREMLVKLLQELDKFLMENRDKKRYELKDLRECNLESMFGIIKFKRRYYYDKEVGDYTFLLDEFLEFKGNRPISPFLEEIAVSWAVKGPSYRDARDRLEEILGHRVLSHETIRQRVLGLAEKIQKEAWCELPTEKKQRQVIFIEVDGLNCHLQREKKSKTEAKIGVVHDGWKKRHPSSKEYNLVDKRYWCSQGDGETFWEEFSRLIYNIYEVNDDTAVVISGDGAKWIKEGCSYFPKAIYVYDRFHLKKWLREALNHQPKHLKKALEASDNYNVGSLLGEVALAEKATENKEDKKKIQKLRHFLLENQDALRDYREILREQGFDTTGMRPMGAAESNMDKFAKRTKKQGYSWSRSGLSAMLFSMIKKFEGTLHNWINVANNNIKPVEIEDLKRSAGRITRKVAVEATGVIQGRLPALYGSEQDKAWVSHFLRRINRADVNIC